MITFGRTGKPIYWECQICDKPKTTHSQRTKRLCKSCSKTKSGDSKTSFYSIWSKLKSDIPYEQFKVLYKDDHDSGKAITLVDGEIVIRELSDAVRLAPLRSNNTSGFVGVFLDKRRDTFYWQVQLKDHPTFSETGFETVESAAIDRNNFLESHHIIATRNTIS